jgi:magnesium-transporting ATPase (P-type)
MSNTYSKPHDKIGSSTTQKTGSKRTAPTAREIIRAIAIVYGIIVGWQLVKILFTGLPDFNNPYYWIALAIIVVVPIALVIISTLIDKRKK